VRVLMQPAVSRSLEMINAAVSFGNMSIRALAGSFYEGHELQTPSFEAFRPPSEVLPAASNDRI